MNFKISQQDYKCCDACFIFYLGLEGYNIQYYLKVTIKKNWEKEIQ